MSLKQLQKDSGVDPDGQFGPKTFKATSAYLGIDNFFCAVHFFAQVAHETGNFKYFEENLNYSSSALRSVFGKYFITDEMADEYARNPEKIANLVYSNRMGNGDEETGDGYKYRGRGALQLTGKSNYESFANSIHRLDIIQKPELVETQYSFQSAKYFFDKNHLWNICKFGLSEDTIKKLTRRINGGYNGLEHRIELTNKYSKYSL